jgi:hypothetical protein
MGKARFPEFLGGRNQGEDLKIQRFFFKTNTPTLQYSSTPADYYWQSHWSPTGPEEPGFTCQNEPFHGPGKEMRERRVLETANQSAILKTLASRAGKVKGRIPWAGGVLCAVPTR